MVRIAIVLIGLLLTPSVWALTKVTATVDRNPVAVKESFVLTVIADDDVDTNALDTSPLLKDFIVGRTSVSTQTSMINFNTTRTTKWSTVLIPKTTGTLLIPSLTVEGYNTTPIRLTVLDAGDPNAPEQKDVFITAEVSNLDVYVQQMMTMTVKLHFSAELKRGSLTEPSLTGAEINQIGQDTESETIINGRRYRVIERTYSINPQQSGEFILTSPMFSGEIMVQSTRRSNFLSFGETRAISVLGDEIPVTIRPIPAKFDGHWLPSEFLSLHQDWQPSANEYKVGEPITRTLTLTAVGVAKEQLPDMSFNLPQGLKVYPDQAELHASINSGRLTSQSVRNFALVASAPGEYTLPEITIPWWNTVTNKMEIARLPSETIIVKPSSEAANNFNPDANSQLPANNHTKQIIITQSSWLQWLFLSLWIATCIAWFASHQISKSKLRDKTTPNKDKTNNHYLALMAACKQADGKQALSLIVPWFNNLSGSEHNVSTIEQVKSFCHHPDLIAAINDLQQHYYGKSTEQKSEHWQGSLLLNAIVAVNKTGLTKNTKQTFSINP